MLFGVDRMSHISHAARSQSNGEHQPRGSPRNAIGNAENDDGRRPNRADGAKGCVWLIATRSKRTLATGARWAQVLGGARADFRSQYTTHNSAHAHGEQDRLSERQSVSIPCELRCAPRIVSLCLVHSGHLMARELRRRFVLCLARASMVVLLLASVFFLLVFPFPILGTCTSLKCFFIALLLLIIMIVCLCILF